MDLAIELRQSLRATSRLMADAHDPWWIIGSAAAALHGAAPINVRDVDVLLSLRDADGLLPRVGLAIQAGAPSSRFRSEVFAKWTDAPLDVEFMANFHWHNGAVWRKVEPRTRQLFEIEGSRIFVPTVSELRTILRDFGRPKDLKRLRLLSSLC